jgi:quercetin dioxygenase-like cupin family protein
MQADQFRQELTQESFQEIVEVSREANGEVGSHTHPFEAKALITAGELNICVLEGIGSGVDRRYVVGDIFHLKPNIPHTEKYGPLGVTYLVGRKSGAPGRN